MDTKTISLLREWAKTYNTESFIKDDPVRFPHRFTEKRDIEISAFLTGGSLTVAGRIFSKKRKSYTG